MISSNKSWLRKWCWTFSFDLYLSQMHYVSFISFDDSHDTYNKYHAWVTKLFDNKKVIKSTPVHECDVNDNLEYSLQLGNLIKDCLCWSLYMYNLTGIWLCHMNKCTLLITDLWPLPCKTDQNDNLQKTEPW